MRQPVTRFTMPLEDAENRLLLALQAHMQARAGKRVPLAVVMREALRHYAAHEKVDVQTEVVQAANR